MSELVDSGIRKNFDTGAEREIIEGKGRCDLLPENIGKIIDYIFNNEKFNTGENDSAYINKILFILLDRKNLNSSSIYDAIYYFCKYRNWDIYTMIIEVSKQFEDGAKKYSDNNWKKGIPSHCYLDSAIRHFIKYMRSDKDEPHDRAFVWNLICLDWTLIYKPEMNDIIVSDDEKTSKEDKIDYKREYEVKCAALACAHGENDCLNNKIKEIEKNIDDKDEVSYKQEPEYEVGNPRFINTDAKDDITKEIENSLTLNEEEYPRFSDYEIGTATEYISRVKNIFDQNSKLNKSSIDDNLVYNYLKYIQERLINDKAFFKEDE